MTTQDFFTSPRFNRIVIGLAAALVILVVFQAGIFVGYRKGLQISSWETDLGRNVDDPHSLFAPFMHDVDDPGSHGAVGFVISVHQPNFMVKGDAQAEQVIMLGPDTEIRRMHDVASTSDLQPGIPVVVIGTPGSDGRLHATFIRILPAPPGPDGMPRNGSPTSSPVRPTPPNY